MKLHGIKAHKIVQTCLLFVSQLCRSVNLWNVGGGRVEGGNYMLRENYQYLHH
jgi:hypothetical protein